jgi:hypothetical protein
MELGDVIDWNGKHWLVRKIEPATATAFLESAEHELDILGVEETCPILCNPLRDWPSLILPPRPGRILSVQRGLTSIPWLHGWVKMEEFQMGGRLYLSPDLQLRLGHRLTIERNDRRNFSVDIPRDFYSVRVKQARVPKVAKQAATPPPVTSSFFAGILEDDE